MLKVYGSQVLFPRPLPPPPQPFTGIEHVPFSEAFKECPNPFSKVRNPPVLTTSMYVLISN